jgi:hypothetical protein
MTPHPLAARRAIVAFFAWLLLAVPVTFLVHESAHWLVGQGLGYDMSMSLNGAAPRGGFATSADAMWVSAAGPIVTILQAVLAFWWLRARDSSAAYAMLFVAWFMRFAAMMVSLMHPNDEARISVFLGLGQWTLPALVVLSLLALLWSANRRLAIGWKVNLGSYALCSVAFALLVMLDAS